MYRHWRHSDKVTIKWDQMMKIMIGQQTRIQEIVRFTFNYTSKETDKPDTPISKRHSMSPIRTIVFSLKLLVCMRVIWIFYVPCTSWLLLSDNVNAIIRLCWEILIMKRRQKDVQPGRALCRQCYNIALVLKWFWNQRRLIILQNTSKHFASGQNRLIIWD